jgi:two-component sensor histidine kinase
LKEVHHRVKNNLQVISSLLNLQTEAASDLRVRAALKDSQGRIMAMAFIHDQLYRSADLAEVDMARYAGRLVDQLVVSYGDPRQPVPVTVSAGVRLELDQAIPCGLILNELMTNALIHAFPPPRTGTVSVEMTQDAETVRLCVRDTGVGLPPEAETRTSQTLGLRVVAALAAQLGGALTILAANPGTEVTVRFPKQGSPS